MKYIIQITTGVIRGHSSRRSAMFVLVVAALVVLFSGMTFLSGWLSENPLIFLLYWAVCAWLTLSAVLLALYDLLDTRAEARRERRRIKEILGRRGDGET